MQPLAITVGPAIGPVGHFRGVGPYSALRDRHGHRVRFAHEARTHDEAREWVRSADVLVQTTPQARPYEDRQDWFREQEERGALVVELDDDEWAWISDPAAATPEGSRRGGSPERLACLESWLAAADVVTVTTESLGAVVRAHGARDVAVCPNALEPPMGALRDWRERRGARVGWTGSIAHLADLPPVLEALERVASLEPALELVALGPVDLRTLPAWAKPSRIAYRHAATTLRDAQTGERVATSHIPFAFYFQTLHALKPALSVVAARDSAFNRGKSDVTLLAWAAQEVPVICSRVGPYAEAERAGFPAIYVEHEDRDAWVAALRELLYEPLRARRLALAAKAWVERHRYMPIASDPWETAVRRAVANAARRRELARVGA